MEKQMNYEAVSEGAGVLSAAGQPGAAQMTQASAEPVTWKDYYRLAKPGIIYSNLLAAFGGFWVASKWDVNLWMLLFTMLGTALVIGSGCVLNNYLDREMDAKMTRTQNRALPSGRISAKTVLWYGIILGILGVSTLYFLVGSPLATLLGIIGLFLYVWVYTAIFKRTSVWSTFVGSFSGAMPPIIGYCAVTGTMDMGAWILFAILFLWQPPHFWALGIRRMEEYRAAGFPLLPVVRGTFVTRISMLRYVVLLVPVTVMLNLYGYVGEIYLIVSTALGLIWVLLCVKGFKAEDEVKWAKGMFIYSINYLFLLVLLMVIDTTSGG
ncbi:heme o synthase [Paenibacillus eucommiae]|uniref:Protoheme IX farnesyltransferase n=1 Tax=Paenibacillus eucommiae TaxID=1355755 RepID=A0ABS4IWT2_9BACL|nr:heme o synthase [Paenibacillus eucommiae]MBP1992043.1 protoheme IX farnesyltransferase [Paenibacillus eucommiae]